MTQLQHFHATDYFVFFTCIMLHIVFCYTVPSWSGQPHRCILRSGSCTVGRCTASRRHCGGSSCAAVMHSECRDLSHTRDTRARWSYSDVPDKTTRRENCIHLDYLLKDYHYIKLWAIHVLCFLWQQTVLYLAQTCTASQKKEHNCNCHFSYWALISC